MAARRLLRALATLLLALAALELTGPTPGAHALLPTLLLPPQHAKHAKHALGYDMRNITSEMLDMNAPTAAHNNSFCREDSLLYRQQAMSAATWALRMYDASTKLPDGLMMGNVVQMGNFDECVGTRAFDAEGHFRFSGQYCLAGLHVTLAAADNETSDPTPPPLPPANRSFNNHLVAVLVGHKLQWAVCLPSTCGPDDLEQHLQERMSELLLGEDEAGAAFRLDVSVRRDNCYRHGHSRLDQSDWAVVFLLSIILLVVAASTVYDLMNPKCASTSLLVAFSVRKNAKALFSLRSHGQMASVNGIKFLSMAWVLLFHKYCVMVETPNVNSDVVLEGLKYDWSQMPISNGGTMAVNSFFVIGGLLLANGFLRDRAAGRPFSLLNFYVYRYLRLTPVYAVVVAFYATLLNHMGKGPLWNPVMKMHRENCRAHWWRNLLYINNYQQVTSEMCVVQSWYLAADMQLYWLSPLLLWPLWRWPRAGRALWATLLVVPIAVPFWLTYSRHYPWADGKDVSDAIRNSYFPLIHASAYARAAPFLVGVALAWILHHTKKDRTRLPKLVVAGGWAVLLLVSWIITHALYIYYKKDHQYSAVEAACFQALHPLGWGLSVAWLIFACERGYGGPATAFLSWKGWQPLSRLTYTAYLVHFAVFYYDLGVTRSPGHYTHFKVVHEVLGDLVLVLLVAAAFALSFEIPMLNVDRALLKPASKPPAASKGGQSGRVNASPPAASVTTVTEMEAANAAPAHGVANGGFEADQTAVDLQRVTKM